MNNLVHFSWLILIMVLAGIFGGYISYLLGKSKETPARSSVVHYLSMGLAASLLVPLFLNMISSDLVNTSKTNPYELLIFLGFCLIASISSKTFIETISGRVFEMAKEAKKIAEGNVAAVQKIADQAEVHAKRAEVHANTAKEQVTEVQTLVRQRNP